ncbi:hypothetical protein GCM10010981_04200 [Dyella nitratireducens]|uniref:Uncharacterized protein n=1 Tax=Dyella nitratireducens TaxID=1849580 RepID=A0ABQ1FKF2_9GAMM|nr:hypothetical protein GCM10010981_04200 [Dyella nitratireducens]GLQ44519.1 hypothetical protein GCM10007902_43690 [Dyella nitratireducens]
MARPMRATQKWTFTLPLVGIFLGTETSPREALIYSARPSVRVGWDEIPAPGTTRKLGFHPSLHVSIDPD